MTAGFVHLRYCPLAHCFPFAESKIVWPGDVRRPRPPGICPPFREHRESFAMAIPCRRVAVGLAEIFPVANVAAASRPVLASVSTHREG